MAATAVVPATVLLGGTLRESPAAGPTGGTPARAAGETLAAGFGTGDTASLVGDLQATLRRAPADAESLALLGLAFQQRYRETADAAYLGRSETALRRALRAEPKNVDAVAGLASLALSRHDFRRALRLGRQALALAPGTARPYGIVGDALAELGRYDEAFRAFDAMARLKPSVASYSRVAYGRELIGRPRRAVEAMQLALSASGGRGEPAAWTSVELGKLHFGQGDLGLAAEAFRAALVLFPGYPFALDGLARVHAARGNDADAIRLARSAVDTVPLPQFAATLGDVLRRSGREREAREQERLVGAIERLLRANGVRTDLETALFDVDHGLRLPAALASARRAHRDRPSVEGDDVLAWALARNGRCGEALGYSRRALRLGTRDASKLFHRGMILRCLDRDAEARDWFRRALAINPHFSLIWSPVARRYAS